MDAISLACVDRSIARHVGSHLTNIADLLAPEDILLDLDVSNKGQLFEAIDRHMVQEHAMAKGFVAMSLANRERVGSTGLGDGVAVPHAHVKNLDHVQLRLHQAEIADRLRCTGPQACIRRSCASGTEPSLPRASGYFG